MSSAPVAGRRKAPGLFALGVFVALLISPAAMALPMHAPVPGGVAILPLGESRQAPRAWWRERPLAVVHTENGWFALLGIPLDASAGQIEISVEVDGRRQHRQLAVSAKDYPSQHLQIKDRNKVSPGAADLLRIEREQAVTDRLKQTFSPGTVASDFQLPAAAPLSSRFGLRRFFNGEARNPHAGLDLRTGAGKAIVAPAAATVLDTGNYFFNGNTVFLDHGQGLVSAYMHLSRTDVRVGQKVEAGSRLGLSGATGRATGPHLHWAVFLNGVAVDPELFLPPSSAPPQRRQ